ncbi:MAG: hypothetical protein K2W79_12915 [Hydrotalea flava]|nr:hypothetical protein [Hydrotalea flava]
MKKNEISKAMIDLVNPILKPLGFGKYRASDSIIFHKKTEFGFNEVPLLIWNYGDFFYVSLTFLIRIDALNKVFLPYSSYVFHEDDKTMTIGADINMFGYQGDHKIKVETEVELQRALILLEEILMKNGLKFFENFQTVKSVDVELNRMNRPLNLYCNEVVDRPIVGITAAALNHNPEFEFWVNFYREKLSKSTEHRKKKYEGLVLHLRSIL